MRGGDVVIDVRAIPTHDHAYAAYGMLTDLETNPKDVSHIQFYDQAGVPHADVHFYELGGRKAVTHTIPGLAAPNIPLEESLHRPGAKILVGDQEIMQLVGSQWLRDAQNQIQDHADHLARQQEGGRVLEQVFAEPPSALQRGWSNLGERGQAAAVIGFAVVAGIGLGALIHRNRVRQEKQRAALAERSLSL